MPKKVNVSKAKSALDFSIKILYFWIIFGVLLILWRVYYFYIGHPVRLWVTILGMSIALWLIGFALYAIPRELKLHKKILCKSYEINKNFVKLKNFYNEELCISWKKIRVLLLNVNNPKIIASGIFFVRNGELHQIRVDADAGVDIAYHCLKWYLDRDEMPKCVIVRDLRTAYKVLKQLVPKRLDPVSEIKPAKKIDEERFLKYIRENFWLDKKAIEMELKRLEKEMNEENLK